MSVSTDSLEILSAPDRINVLSDHKRMEIFQLLMVKPRTVSQLGRILDEFPAGVRYHIKKQASRRSYTTKLDKFMELGPAQQQAYEITGT